MKKNNGSKNDKNIKCSSKRNSCLFKKEKGSESHVLLEREKRKKCKYQKQGLRNKIKK